MMVARTLSLEQRVDLLASLYATILDSHRPADRELTAFLRKHKKLGRKERDLVARTIHDMLRRRLHNEAVASELSYEPGPRTFVWIHLLCAPGLSPADLPRQDTEIDAAMAAIRSFRARPEPEDPAEAVALKHSLPTWIVASLIDQLGAEEASKLAAALRRPPPLTLRVNTLKGSRRDLALLLSEEGVETTPTNYSPVGLTVRGHARVMKTRAFEEGWFEIQDEGSQLITLLVGARPGQKIVDACAGAGGKTLHLAAEMKNKGMLYTMDAFKHRLDKCRPRARRAGVHNLRLHALDKDGPAKVKRLKRSMDAVLIDAPCSGVGAIRRNPDDAWRIDSESVERYSETQLSLLGEYAKMVKVGGRLVYATCSLLAEENERVVESFLAAHPHFEVVDVRDVFATEAEVVPESPFDSPFMRLMPHLHGTDGFFAAAMTRRPGTGSAVGKIDADQAPETVQEAS